MEDGAQPPEADDGPAEIAAREKMVSRQIEARGVRDPVVLAAMRRVPRHSFVPGRRERCFAYLDEPLPIGAGQTISQPYIVALMTELLGVVPGDRVLEIGTGSGYQTAVLAEVVGCGTGAGAEASAGGIGEVFSVEIVEGLSARASKVLGELGYRGITFRAGDGTVGWPEAAPFDGVLAAAAPETVPPALLDQVRPGGRVVIPVGGRHEQELVVFEKSPGGEVKRRAVIPVRFVPMTGAAGGVAAGGGWFSGLFR